MNDEIWKEIEGFSNYQISNYGRVCSLQRKGTKGGILKAVPDKDGYMRVHLYKDKKSYHRKVHRLVAKAFIPNPNNYPQINHKDGIKNNNYYKNLEWSTVKENHYHAWNVLGVNGSLKPRPVIGYNLVTGQIVTFKCLSDANKYGFDKSSISKCCLGKRKTHKNYTWQYE